VGFWMSMLLMLFSLDGVLRMAWQSFADFGSSRSVSARGTSTSLWI
jgi:hypothetical protein